MKALKTLISLFILISCARPPDQSDSSQLPELSIYEVGARPQAIAVADFNGDTQSDTAVANSGEDTVTFGD